MTGQINRSHETKEVQASAAKARLAELLDEVERGETIVITRHGKPVARLVPDPAGRQREIEQAIADIKEMRKHTGRATLEEISEWRDEGRS
jgi:prevent-host-death family protein